MTERGIKSAIFSLVGNYVKTESTDHLSTILFALKFAILKAFHTLHSSPEHPVSKVNSSVWSQILVYGKCF